MNHLIVDGSAVLEADHASRAIGVVDGESRAAFAAPPGGRLFAAVHAGRLEPGQRIDAAALVAGAWVVGPATVRRDAFDRMTDVLAAG